MVSKETSEASSDFLKNNYAIYILGAGFSRPAGLPLAADLWKVILDRGLKMSGRASLFRDDLLAYIEYKNKCDAIELKIEDVDSEEFLAYLDIEHFLGLRGNDTWSDQGNEAQIVVKTLIGKILTESTPTKEEIPELYLKFVKILKPNDLVFTFNYDVLLERALDSVGVQYRLFPERLKEHPQKPDLLLVDSREEVIVIKLHGSVDWFDRSLYKQLEEERIRDGFPPGGSDLLFKNPKDFGVLPLLEGPHYTDDPLDQVYRIEQIERLYERGILFHYTPVIQNPSSMKVLYSKQFRNFWDGLGKAGVLNFRMAIIGYSLPKQDEYSRQVIYRLVENYQSTYWEDDTWMHKKAPLVLIDFRETREEEEAYKKRYAFVQWDRAITHFTGFDDEAIELLRR